jgi:hypothetical protein
MKIEQYISQLLYRYQCVTVPGFGAFLTEFQSAQLDESSHSFYPPKKLISFNPYLKNNDGLLANHLAQAEKMSYEIAVNAIQNEVSHWKTKIQELGHFSIKNIGEFSLNAEKNLVFVPVDQINYLKESFGLSSFVSPSVKREVYKELVEAIEEKAPIAFTPERRRNYSALKYAAIFTLSIGLTGVLGYKLYDNYLKQVEQETLLVQSNVQKKINQKIQEATFFIESPLPAVTLTVASEKTPYHVVAGAFRLESNAQKAYDSLLKLGFKAKRLPANKHGLHPVLYGSYTSYSEARQAMNDIQKLDNKDAWLLIQEL